MPTLVKVYSRGETWKALSSISAFMALRVLNSVIFQEAQFKEVVLKKTLTSYERGIDMNIGLPGAGVAGLNLPLVDNSGGDKLWFYALLPVLISLCLLLVLLGLIEVAAYLAKKNEALDDVCRGGN